MIGAKNLHALVEIGNYPIVKKKLMQMHLNRGGVLGLHDFPNKSYKPGRREYMVIKKGERTKIVACHEKEN